MISDSELSERVEEIIDEKFDELEREPQSTRVSRRGTLGLAGLVGLGAVGAGSSSAAAVEDHTLEEHLDCNGYALESVGAIDGNITNGDRLESLTGANLTISDGQLDAAGGDLDDNIVNRLDDATTRLEIVAGTGNKWRVGPTAPAGDYHYLGAFGTLIETDRPVYFGECTIDTDSAGQFTPALYEYDESTDTLNERIDSITIQATGSQQTIFLDFLVEEPGEYLLTRLLPESPSEDEPDGVPDDIWKPEDDEIELRRSADYASGYDDDSQNGVTFQGGYNPYYAGMDEPNDSYYYYFDLEVSSAEH